MEDESKHIRLMREHVSCHCKRSSPASRLAWPHWAMLSHIYVNRLPTKVSHAYQMDGSRGPCCRSAHRYQYISLLLSSSKPFHLHQHSLSNSFHTSSPSISNTASYLITTPTNNHSNTGHQDVLPTSRGRQHAANSRVRGSLRQANP
jgi:hypothetical protein